MKTASQRKPPPSRGVPKSPPKLKLLPPVEDPAIEQALVRRGVEETVQLCVARGDLFRKPISKGSPWQRMSEMDIMLSRGEITNAEFDAGRRYGDRYREAHLRGIYRSSLRMNDRQRGGLGYDNVMLDRIGVLKKLQRDRLAAFGVDPVPSLLCDALCGEDSRVVGTPEQREAVVAVMKWALKRLVRRYDVWEF